MSLSNFLDKIIQYRRAKILLLNTNCNSKHNYDMADLYGFPLQWKNFAGSCLELNRRKKGKIQHNWKIKLTSFLVVYGELQHRNIYTATWDLCYSYSSFYFEKIFIYWKFRYSSSKRETKDTFSWFWKHLSETQTTGKENLQLRYELCRYEIINTDISKKHRRIVSTIERVTLYKFH